MKGVPTGQISLGHAGFFAIGAYGTALLMAKLQIPFVLAILIAAFNVFGIVLNIIAVSGKFKR